MSVDKKWEPCSPHTLFVSHPEDVICPVEIEWMDLCPKLDGHNQ